MPYIEETCIAGNTIERYKYYSPGAHPKGERREKKEKPSKESVKKANLKRAERKLRRLMNTNFKDGDYSLTLDFYKEQRPGNSEDMQGMVQTFLKRLRYRYKKAGKQMKYIYVKEVGPKGARHIHMVLNKCDTDWIRECWTYGGIHIDPMFTEGQYSKLASYFVKYEEKTQETEKGITPSQRVGKYFYPSRGLEQPIIKKKKIRAGHFSKRITVPDGYYLDKDSVFEGISEYNGYEYFGYTLIRNETRGRPKEGG